VAYSVDKLSHAQRVGVSDRGRGQVRGFAGQPEQREIPAPAALHHFGIEPAAVVEGYRDVAAPSRDHVVIGHNQTIGVPDHAGPDAAAAAAHLHDAPLGPLDHLGAGQDGGGVSR